MEDQARLGQLRDCLEDYLRQKGIHVKKPFKCLNPEHEDKHPSMSYNVKGKNVHCFSCGATYDIFDLVGLDYGIGEFPGQLSQACKLFGVRESKDKKGDKAQRRTHNTRAGYGTAALELNRVESSLNLSVEGENLRDRSGELDKLRQRSHSGQAYFHERGITKESCTRHKLFQAEGRAYFPVYRGGLCTGWCGRAIEPEMEPRYLNSKGAIGIWNGDLLREPGGGRMLYITEGIIDAICLEQMGEKSVALCGSQNAGKLLALCESNSQAANGWFFVACGDPDAAGWKMNLELKEGLERLGLSCAALSLEEADGDINRLYLNRRDRLERLLGQAQEESRAEALEYASSSAAGLLEDFFIDRERRAEQDSISTGFSEMDKLLDGGLHPGLYVIGAISSLGKTSFVLQMADYISENCCDVLFISLEQSRFELMAKSLSRTTAVLDTSQRKEAFTSRQLLSGQPPGNFEKQRLLEEARQAYAASASGLFIREGIADIGVSEIREAVRRHLALRGQAPVVMVDYLQILRPFDPRSTDKQNVDKAVVELKRLSRDFNIPILAISSFNRENYRNAVSMEAFKESGAVEYSSDVLFGMQLAGAGVKGFDANEAKAREPRQVELVMLKNRNGIPYAKVGFDYYAKFNLFDQRTSQGKLSLHP